jgi:predicted nucleic acid-binding protein
MIALGTNVLARYLLDDEPRQSAAARRLLSRADQSFWVPITVLLELAWVLKSRGVPREAMLEAMRALAGLGNVHLQSPEIVSAALQFAEGGIDVADAIHLALSAKAERFASFDAQLARQARKLATTPPVEAVVV